MKVFDTYPGGKGADGTYQTLINLIPPHHMKICGYLGNCSIMRYLQPAEINVGIDTDLTVIDRWKKAGMKDLDLFNMPFLEYWKQYGNAFNFPDTFIFLDPPYPFSVRRSKGNIYNCEMSEVDHEQLLSSVLARIDISNHAAGSANVMICTYANHPETGRPNKLYNHYLKKWSRVDYVGKTRKGPVTETVYMNYALDGKLHDYRYLGTDFIDRQRIKRKIERHVNKLQGLPPMERNAILQQLTASFDTVPG